ncbi:LAMI_0E09516g1_1 [Lachancea mirantina]|uniref:LAMI_0E09516g1_1 n=1 Tax=Lachancea mirantina TaxID=1230905 RepID=A0A1G4JNJ6_9SACH|nr:LAMI_0E09516g1_1 [Lachancea mirantina]
MHILLTNDDGPPDPHASPYVRHLVQHIVRRRPDWRLTICVPDRQRSWIGKAHFAGRDAHARFAYMARDATDEALLGPFPQPQRVTPDSALPCIENSLVPEDAITWCLVDGTPATCTDIGLHHLCNSDIDLVISGPNVGRNTSAAYITSSGTVGAAMEAVWSAGKRAIAVSWAYSHGNPQVREDILIAAAEKTCSVIDALIGHWHPSAHFYSVNVPLIETLGPQTRAVYTHIWENTWCSIFELKDDGTARESSDSDALQIADARAEPHGITFRWRPNFARQRNVTHTAKPLNDLAAVDEGHVSVTALRAVFQQVEPLKTGELPLEVAQSLPFESSRKRNTRLLLSVPSNDYIRMPLLEAFARHVPEVRITDAGGSAALAHAALKHATAGVNARVLHYGEYEHIDFDRLSQPSGDYYANCYAYRKALIRKHYLAHTVRAYVAKNPNALLAKAFMESFPINVDYAEFLDDALDEAWELRQELEREQKWWILKPSMSDKAQGIRVFKSVEELQAIFDSFEEEGVSDDDEKGENHDTRVVTSQLRDFLVQEYLLKPLLLPSMDNRKFHIRCYVTSRGDLQVFVFDRMLALFAPSAFVSPAEVSEYSPTDINALACHLTNTCLYVDENFMKTNAVREFDDLSDLSTDEKLRIKSQIHEITKELFLAAVTTNRMNFQPLERGFEIYGLDFLVDENLDVKVLEVNAFPDFKQTGEELRSLVEELFDEVVKQCVVPIVTGGNAISAGPNFSKVLDHQSHNW